MGERKKSVTLERFLTFSTLITDKTSNKKGISKITSHRVEKRRKKHSKVSHNVAKQTSSIRFMVNTRKKNKKRRQKKVLLIFSRKKVSSKRKE